MGVGRDSRRCIPTLSSRTYAWCSEPLSLKRFGPALAERDFRLWWLALLGMGTSLQALEVAIGWEVYFQHRSVLDLGWIGSAEFIPMFALALTAGQLADRVPRRL